MPPAVAGAELARVTVAPGDAAPADCPGAGDTATWAGTDTTMTLPPPRFLVDAGTTTSCVCDGERRTVCVTEWTVASC